MSILSHYGICPFCCQCWPVRLRGVPSVFTTHSFSLCAKAGLKPPHLLGGFAMAAALLSWMIAHHEKCRVHEFLPQKTQLAQFNWAVTWIWHYYGAEACISSPEELQQIYITHNIERSQVVPSVTFCSTASPLSSHLNMPFIKVLHSTPSPASAFSETSFLRILLSLVALQKAWSGVLFVCLFKFCFFWIF